MILPANGPLRASEFSWGRVYSRVLPAAARSKWAWLADTHIAGDESAERSGWQTASRLRRIVAEISAVGPCGAVVNGDLAWSRGEVEDYRRFLAIAHPLASGSELVLGVGNHDNRGNLLAALAEPSEPAPARLVAMVDQPPNRFVMLDSLIDAGEVGGEIGSEQLAWLESTLSNAPPMRTFLFVHHPGRSASRGCRDFGALIRLAESYRCIQAVVTGHEHEFSLGRARGVHRIGLPAAGFPFDAGVPCGWIEASLSSESIELRFHDNEGAISHVLEWQ